MDKCASCVYHHRKIKSESYCKLGEYFSIGYYCSYWIDKDSWEIERLKEFKEWIKDYRTWDEERKEKWIYERWKENRCEDY